MRSRIALLAPGTIHGGVIVLLGMPLVFLAAVIFWSGPPGDPGPLAGTLAGCVAAGVGFAWLLHTHSFVDFLVGRIVAALLSVPLLPWVTEGLSREILGHLPALVAFTAGCWAAAAGLALWRRRRR